MMIVMTTSTERVDPSVEVEGEAVGSVIPSATLSPTSEGTSRVGVLSTDAGTGHTIIHNRTMLLFCKICNA